MTRIGPKRTIVAHYFTYFLILTTLGAVGLQYLLAGRLLAVSIVLAMNLAAFLLMGLDKAKAGGPQVRLPESFFYLIALIGASVGVLAGVQIFRHKSSKESFLAVLSAIVLLQILVGGYLLMQTVAG